MLSKEQNDEWSVATDDANSTTARSIIHINGYNLNAVVKCFAFFQAGPVLQWRGTICWLSLQA